MKRTASGMSSAAGAIRWRPRMGGAGGAAPIGVTESSARISSFMPMTIASDVYYRQTLGNNRGQFVRLPARRARHIFAIALALAASAAAQAGGGNQPGTKWTDEQLRQAAGLARVGRRLTPKAWPHGARVAVCL